MSDKIRIEVAVNVRRFDTYEVSRETWAAIAAGNPAVKAEWEGLDDFDRAVLGLECVDASDVDLIDRVDLLDEHGELVDTSEGERTDDPETSVIAVTLLEGGDGE